MSKYREAWLNNYFSFHKVEEQIGMSFQIRLITMQELIVMYSRLHISITKRFHCYSKDASVSCCKEVGDLPSF